MPTSASLLTMPGFKHHIFICTNQREPGSPRGCCNPNGNAELHKAFKDAIAARGLKATVRANKSGCLDQCEHGPDRKSTRLNSSHMSISYAVFCLKKKMLTHA